MLQDMTEGKPWRLILTFSLPMLLGNIFQQLYNTADSVIVGRYVGSNALAAVGTSFPVIFFLLSLIMGLTMGSGVVISQFYGAGKLEEVRRSVTTSIIFQVVCALVMTVIGLIFAGPMLRLLQVPDVIYNDSLTYANIFFCGLIFMMGYNSLSGILRSLGDSRTPLFFLIIAAVTNVVLDIYFVASLGWGVAGVAWATLIAQALSMILCYIYINAKIPLLKFTRQELVFDKDILKTMIKLGIPSSIQQTVVSMGMMAVQGIVNSFGEITMAAFVAAMRIDSFATMPVQNFSMALSTFGGQNVGAWRLDRVKEGTKSTLIMSLVTCIVLSILVFNFGPQLITIFLDSSDISNAAVIAQGVEYIITIAYFYVVFAVSMTINGTLRGAGDTMTPMFTSLTNLAVRVAVAYVLSYGMFGFPELGYKAIWYSIPCGWIAGAVVPIYRYISGKWQQKARERYENMKRMTDGDLATQLAFENMES